VSYPFKRDERYEECEKGTLGVQPEDRGGELKALAGERGLTDLFNALKML